MPQKYRKKPVIIEAIQWNGNNIDDIVKFASLHITYTGADYFYINTLEGVMKASLNDYIIKGVDGEYYPCKPNIFEQTYERIEE